MCPKKNFGLKIILDLKKILGLKKKFDKKIIWVQKKFSSKKILCKKNLGLKKILVLKIFLVRQNFGCYNYIFLYLKHWPVRIFKDFPFSLYIVAASKSDESLVSEPIFFSDPNFFIHKIFSDENFFIHKIFSDKIFYSDPKIFFVKFFFQT